MDLPIHTTGVIAAFALPLLAQTVWNVPNGAPVDPVINMAAPGDIVQLSGSHPGFVLNKGLTVLGPATIVDVVAIQTANTLVQPPPGQTACLVDVSFSADLSATFVYGPRVRVDGAATFESCTFSGYLLQTADAVVEVTSGTVLFDTCEFSSLMLGSALRLAGGACALTACDLNGSVSGGFLALSTSAAVVTGGTMLASQCEFDAGRIGFHPGAFPADGAPALEQSGGSSRLTDCILRGGEPAWNSLQLGAPAIVGNGGVAIARTQLVPGANPFGPSTGYTDVPEMPGMTATGSLVVGTTWTTTVTPGDAELLLGVVGSFVLTSTTAPGVSGPVFGAPGTQLPLATTVPVSGQPVVLAIPVPNVPALAGQTFFCQAFEVGGGTVHASSVVGGAVR